MLSVSKLNVFVMGFTVAFAAPKVDMDDWLEHFPEESALQKSIAPVKEEDPHKALVDKAMKELLELINHPELKPEMAAKVDKTLGAQEEKSLDAELGAIRDKMVQDIEAAGIKTDKVFYSEGQDA